MFRFFAKRPVAPGDQPIANPNVAPTTGADPQVAQPQPKPTGQFSPKQIRAVVIVAAVTVLFFLILMGQKPAAKLTALQKQAQDASTTALNSATGSSRDYQAALAQALKPSPIATPQYPGAPAVPNSYPGQPSGLPTMPNAAGYPYASPPGGPGSPQQPYSAAYPQTSPSSSVPSSQADPRDPQLEARQAMQADDEKREHESLASGLIVRSDRIHPAGAPAPSPVSAAPAPPQSPSVSTASSTNAAVIPPIGTAPPNNKPPAAPLPNGPGKPAADDLPSRQGQPRNFNPSASNKAAGPTYKLFEGTFIEAVLTNRLNSSYTGPVDCMITVDIWSHSREHLLIPQGTRALGEAKRVTHLGQDRLAVLFHRLVMPDGYSVSLDNFTALNQIGETGLNDKVNHHYLQIVGASVALGAIAGLAVQGTSSAGLGVAESASSQFRQGFAQQLSQEATQILDRFLNILPTVTIREGVRVKVYLLDDLSLPSYDNHKIASDL